MKFRPAMTVSKTDEGYAFYKMTHVCGSDMMICERCNRCFCVDCDLYLDDLPECCRNAKHVHFNIPKRSSRTGVVIEEIGDGNL